MAIIKKIIKTNKIINIIVPLSFKAILEKIFVEGRAPTSDRNIRKVIVEIQHFGIFIQQISDEWNHKILRVAVVC